MAKRTKKMTNNGYDNTEVPTIEENIIEGEYDADIEHYKRLPSQPVGAFVRAAVMIASKLGVADQYEIGQAGPLEFNLETLLNVVYRMEAPYTDAEIAKDVQRMKRTQYLVPGSKRGWYCACAMAQMSEDAFRAEMDKVIGPRKNPNV